MPIGAGNRNFNLQITKHFYNWYLIFPLPIVDVLRNVTGFIRRPKQSVVTGVVSIPVSWTQILMVQKENKKTGTWHYLKFLLS